METTINIRVRRGLFQALRQASTLQGSTISETLREYALKGLHEFKESGELERLAAEQEKRFNEQIGRMLSGEYMQ